MPPSSAATMLWETATSKDSDGVRAAEQAALALKQWFADGPPDLVLAFFRPSFVPQAEAMRAILARELSPACLGGVSASGVIEPDEEIEDVPALVLIGARLPGVKVAPFLLTAASWTEAAGSAAEFERVAPGAREAELTLLFADPFTVDIDALLRAFQRQAPGARVVGGLASASGQRGGNAFFLNDWSENASGFAVALSGELRVDVVVSQGCRAIGPPLSVTHVERNVVGELDGIRATQRLRQVFADLSGPDQARFRSGLFLGRPVRPGAEGRGDYLVRSLLGHDPESGSIAVGDLVTQGERVRLHVRDAVTAREDLELLLAPQAFDTPARAALVFSCNGRGKNLYGEPDGDISILQKALGGVPAAGVFCVGEVGPIGERNYLHGHTAVIALIRPK